MQCQSLNHFGASRPWEYQRYPRGSSPSASKSGSHSGRNLMDAAFYEAVSLVARGPAGFLAWSATSTWNRSSVTSPVAKKANAISSCGSQRINPPKHLPYPIRASHFQSNFAALSRYNHVRSHSHGSRGGSLNPNPISIVGAWIYDYDYTRPDSRAGTRCLSTWHVLRI
ncbi:hypothetical protein BC826DRAFT_667347 [Russula brevipes]|nr:hypothetical protein BC826DRAFT_667347 [Russula brevipes]